MTHSEGNLLWTRILEDWVMWTVFVFLAWTYVLWRFLIDSSGGWNKVFIPAPCPGKGCRDQLSILLGGHSTAGRWPRLTTSRGCLKQFSFHIHLVTGLFMCDFWWPWTWEMKRAGCLQEQCGQSSVCVPLALPAHLFLTAALPFLSSVLPVAPRVQESQIWGLGRMTVPSCDQEC